MTEHLEAVVKSLAEKQVGFYVRHDCPGGQVTIALSPDAILRYAADPLGFLAVYYGVTRDDYLEWHRSNYSVRCSGFTKSGKPCKATVPGLSLVSNPAEWARGRGGRCSVHG